MLRSADRPTIVFVDRPDASLHTLGFGNGPRNLVAIGGWVGSGEGRLDQVGRLGPEWHVFAVDHRESG